MRFFSAASAIVLALLVLGTASAPAGAADDGLSLAANNAFMAAYAKKAGIVQRPSGLQYHILHSGFGRRVGPSDIVQISYSAQLINGKVFDGTSPGLPVFLSVSSVLRGLSEALQLMHEGDHWQFLIPSDMAFGMRGAGNGAIPPGQALLFDLTVISTRPAAMAQADGSGGMTISTYNREGGTSRQEGFMLNIPQ
jgi:FKBP-type peptidyl-prolyl cis-trans isomerase